MKNLAMPLIAISVLICAACSNTPQNKGSSAKTDTVNKSITKEDYTCLMDTDVHSDKPGTCPKCGMELVKQKK